VGRIRYLRRQVQRYRAFGVVQGSWIAALAVLRRLGGRERVVRVRVRALAHPVYLRPGTSDVWIFDEVVTKREYALPGVVPPSTVIDAGANIGLATAFFATAYPDATILAIEPAAANYELLVRNTAPYEHVITRRAALWWERAMLALEDSGEGHESYRMGPGGTAPPALLVESLDLAALMEEHGLDHVDVLKLDIEGAECAVLERSAGWIDRVGAIAAELHDEITPGCTAAFDAATVGFDEERRCGETVVRLRRSALATGA
jgi:FkbM family methyltransferase